MIELFKPTWMVETAYNIDPQALKDNGIRAVFSDLDNNLTAWNNPNGTPEMREWMNRLEGAGIPLIIISNNKAKRVAKAVETLKLPFMARSLKPLAFGIARARTKLGLAKSEVVMVGDQLMTDIAAANSAGVRSILVKPLVDTDKWITRINRLVEKPVMERLKHRFPQDIKWQEKIN